MTDHLEEGPTPDCICCGETAEPYPFSCPVCEAVHHAACWRSRGGCSATECDYVTHVPRPEHQGRPPSRRSVVLRRTYLRFVARMRERHGVDVTPQGLGLGLVGVAAVLGLIVWTILR